MTSSTVIAVYGFIPMIVALIGGWIASFYTPQKKWMSALQHFVAGIVIGAATIELLPKILGKSSPWTIGIGFVLGALAMLGVHEFAHFLAKKGKKSTLPIGMIIGSALDLFLDGLLIGVSFLAGTSGGVLIAISLSFCAFFLVMALSSSLSNRQIKKSHQGLIILLTTLLLPIGAFVGSVVISHFPQTVLTETLAFGVAALLFLGIEELLVEAHGSHDTLPISSCFFLGFLVILLLRV